jgi:DNA mismatch repair protein MutS
MLKNKTTPFHSILFAKSEEQQEMENEPSFFRDLNLDQVIKAIIAGRQQYNLRPFFFTSLRDIDAIKYRQQVFRDLDGTVLLQNLRSFAQRMEQMREHLGLVKKLYYARQKQRWFLDAVGVYCQLVRSLADDLSRFSLRSKGLLSFRDFLIGYVESSSFIRLLERTRKLQEELAAIQYCIRIKGGSFKVQKLESQYNYSDAVEETFAKFQQGSVKDYRVQFSESVQMNHIEAKVLEFVARLHPEIFSALDNFCSENANFLDETVTRFDREIQFYIAYLDHIEKFRRRDLKFCYPVLSDQPNDIHSEEVFDLALADKLVREAASVVSNDFHFCGDERVFVVSGPNQGGKTTFARAFGQAHYLSSLGLLVPGREARLLLFDRLFTHFEREEKIANLRGKLQDDLLRIRDDLNKSTSVSILILNEIFTSTTVRDALFLSEEILKRIIELGALCIWVTFVNELASFGKQVVSMVATVDRQNPTLRTFKIVRSAPGPSYAMSIAERHRLTYNHLKERLKS